MKTERRLARSQRRNTGWCPAGSFRAPRGCGPATLSFTVAWRGVHAALFICCSTRITASFLIRQALWTRLDWLPWR